MGLLKKWKDIAYSETANKGDLQRLWTNYFQKEKEIYMELLKTPDEVVEGTVKELAEKFGVELMTMTGFLDGINDSLKEANPIEEMEEDTKVNLGFDKELLYKNMVAAGADWLYNLEEWNDIFDEEKRAELEIPSIDGKVKWTLPAGTQPGAVFRLRGTGMPNVNGRGRGDQYINVTVQVPTSLNSEQKEALRAFGVAMGELPFEEPEGPKGFFGKKGKKH